MHRFFTDDISGEFARVTGEDVRHIVRVLRLKKGDAITLCDGAGTDYDASIVRLTDEWVECRVGAPYPSRSEADCRITVYQCLPKTGKMETIVQKCTELGADAFVPVLSRRCVAQPAGNFENRRVRYQRVALEAAKQSRRGRIPAVGALTKLEALDPSQFDLFLLAYEDEQGASLKRVLQQRKDARTVAILIGSEGGFESSEVAALTARGAVSVSLGARILRTETAGMAMVAQILYEAEP